MCSYPHFLYYWRALKPFFANFQQPFPLHTDFHTTFTNFHQFLLRTNNFSQLLTNFYFIFHQLKIILFLFFFHLLIYTNPSMLLDAMLQSLILCLSLFTCIRLSKSVLPGRKSNKSNTWKIIFIKIIIIKVNIIKCFSIMGHIISKECSHIRV